MSFACKVVIVTGASSGIGAATAILFTKEGADVVIVGRNEAKLEHVRAQCKEYGKEPLVIKADVSVDSEANKIITNTIDKFGRLDILINNAGALHRASILDGTFLEVYEMLARTNLRAVIKLTTLAAPHLVKTKGNIVNISSTAGIKVVSHMFSAYGLTKAALNQFSQSAAMELSPNGVRVNTISPGLVYTDIWENSKENLSELNFKPGSNRISTPDEIANLILYVASDKAVGITGSNYIIDNGLLTLV